VLKADYDPLRWVASINEDDTLLPVVSLGAASHPNGCAHLRQSGAAHRLRAPDQELTADAEAALQRAGGNGICRHDHADQRRRM